MRDYALTDQCSAEFSMETIHGREFRVARWRWNMVNEHLPVLFLNGIGTNIEAVAALAETMCDRPFIMFDMPGVGGSPKPGMPYTLFTMCTATRELLRRFECERVDVIGLSWGGALAQQFALQHGDCVRRLVLCATSAGIVSVPGGASAMVMPGKPSLFGGAGDINRHFKRIYSRLTARDPGLAGAFLPPTTRGLAYQLLALWGWTSAPALPFLPHETLIMMGAHDEIVPLANGRILEALIPRSRLEIVTDGGHLFLLTHRVQTLALLREFLDAPGRLTKHRSTQRKAA